MSKRRLSIAPLAGGEAGGLLVGWRGGSSAQFSGIQGISAGNAYLKGFTKRADETVSNLV
jgi:hypothetical protein